MIEDAAKVITDFCESQGIEYISWRAYNKQWSAFVIKEKYTKNGQFIGVERETLTEAIEAIKAQKI